MTSLSVLPIDDLQVATPCPASWDEMLGDSRVRFCGQCEKNVYNLSHMTRLEITDLIEETEGVFCGRLYRRDDGTVLTADCPIGLAERAKIAARRMGRRATVGVALLTVTLLSGALGFLAGGRSACPTTTTKLQQVKQTVEQLKPKLEKKLTPVDPHVAGGMAWEPEMELGDMAAPEPSGN